MGKKKIARKNLEMTIAEFCELHGACRDGREWALANCKSMAQAWKKAKSEWVIWIAIQPDVLDDKTLRLFAVWSARQVQHLMTDKRSTDALDTAERFANGKATDEELAAARAAAWAAAGAAAGDAAWAAAGAAAGDAAWDAAWAAARAAAGDAARAAARAAAGAAQKQWLLKNARPNFRSICNGERKRCA